VRIAARLHAALGDEGFPCFAPRRDLPNRRRFAFVSREW
jgi:hypothetical protein